MQETRVAESSSTDKTDFWRHHLSAWEKSGLTQTKYCQQEKISHDQFGYWRKKFLEKARKKTKGNFLSVPLSQSTLPQFFRIRLMSQALIEIPINTPETKLSFIFKSLGLNR